MDDPVVLDPLEKTNKKKRGDITDIGVARIVSTLKLRIRSHY